MTGPGRQQHPLYGPHPPHPQPTAAPPHSPRGPLIIASAIIAVAVAISTVVVITRSDDAQPPATRQTATDPTAPALVRVDPPTLLPTADQVRAATHIDAKGTNPPSIGVRPDTATTPPQCTAAAAPASQTVWGTAVSAASQKFGDSIDKSQPISIAATSVAVFDTADDAFDSFNKVSASVHSCTGYTAPDDSGGGPSAWTLVDIRSQDGRLMWTENDSGATGPRKCAKAYRAQSNVASFVVVCGSSPSDASAKLADQIITTATKH